MERVRSNALPLAVVASFLAVGTPYWSIPYGKVNLPDALLGPSLLVVVACALLLRAYGIVSFWSATWATGASVALAVAVRVLVGAAQDPTSHNLWPLEVAIALAVGWVCALAGASAGSLIAALLPRHGDGGKPG